MKRRPEVGNCNRASRLGHLRFLLDCSNDLQEVAVTQNFEKKASVKAQPWTSLCLASGLAMAGDMGGSIGPFVIGFVTQNTGDDLKGRYGWRLHFLLYRFCLFSVRQRNAEQNKHRRDCNVSQTQEPDSPLLFFMSLMREGLKVHSKITYISMKNRCGYSLYQYSKLSRR